MKTLYIIRHAKSSWDLLWVKDFDREICEKWKNDLKLIWDFLKEKEIIPDVIFSSPAKRAKITIEKICKKIWYDENKIIYENWIYDNHMEWLDFYLDFLSEINNKYNSVFLVWHNPYSSELASYFLQENIWNVPTSGVVSISFEIDSWKNILDFKWKLNFFMYPDKLK